MSNQIARTRANFSIILSIDSMVHGLARYTNGEKMFWVSLKLCWIVSKEMDGTLHKISIHLTKKFHQAILSRTFYVIAASVTVLGDDV